MYRKVNLTIKKNMERHAEHMANDHYKHCYGSEGGHRYIGDIVITDGIKEVAEKEECFWFLDIIISYQFYPEFKNATDQVWELNRIKDCEFEVIASDTYGNILVIQKIPFSDFFFQELKVYMKDKIILLPSED